MNQLLSLTSLSAIVLALGLAFAGSVRGDEKAADVKEAPAKEAPAKEAPARLDPLARARQERAADDRAAQIPIMVRPVQLQQAQLDAQTQQYVQMLQPTLWAELDFVRQICPPKPEQRPKIKAAADESVLEAAKDIANPQRGRRTTPTGASQRIRDGIKEALRETLDAKAFEQYEQELRQRGDFRKQAAILGVVSRMEEILSLTTEQRDKITQALESKWQEAWEHWLAMAQYGNQYFPNVPDQHVTPHLTPQQLQVWRGLQKIEVNSWGGGRQQNDDAWWEGKPDGDKPARPAGPIPVDGFQVEP